jgi:Ca-activated chloride channel family protein
VVHPAAAAAVVIGAMALAAVPRAQTPTGPAPGAQPPAQQPPTFRVGAETVPIYTTVLDRYGEIVRSLKREDFDVYDNGQLQELTVFEAGLQPISAAIMVDTSASMTLNLRLALSAAEQFVIRLLPGDRARVGSFSDRVDFSAEFTSDRDRLLRGLQDIHFGNPTKLWDAVDTTLSALAPLGGRRVVLLLTDGMDTASSAIPDAVLARSRANEVMVYVVQFRSNFQANLAEFSTAPSASQLFGDDEARRARISPAYVARLARQTGGGHFVLGQYDDVNATFSQVMQELHFQYVLGFTPQVLDGRLHQIDIRVRRPNLTVRARTGYLAANGARAAR